MATLASLGLPPAPGVDPDLEISGLASDSRKAGPGVVFFALKGSVDGAEFAPFALRMGSPMIVCSPEGAETIRALWRAEGREVPPEGLPLAVSEAPRLALARAAAAFFALQPEGVAAVTGTNGKTSVASFLRQLWTQLGRRAVNIGTVGVEGAVDRPGGLTTPDPLTMHALLAELADLGVERAAIEASSHGLAQHRADGVRLRAAGLTNVTRDHLDYHPTPEDYLQAKLGLFARVLPADGTAALNADDPSFLRAAEIVRARGQRLIAVGRAELADLRLLSAEFHETGQTLQFSWEGETFQAELPLVGAFQGENALMAAALAIGCGEEPRAVFAALPALTGVKGRMEHVATRENGARVYVDYSHTPDSLSTAIAALRLHTPGRLVVVFGAGGDRDAGKRPLMGRAALAADIAVVTDDNPRSEDPAAIRAQVLAGAEGADPAPIEIGDRAEAILNAVDMLGPQDRLLIAGKGHETGQIVGQEVIPFDDAEQARAAVQVLDAEDETGDR